MQTLVRRTSMIGDIYPSVLQAVSGGAMQVAWSGCFQGTG